MRNKNEYNGPWKTRQVENDTNAFDVYNASGAKISRGYWGHGNKANAHLIAAAPELFRALELLASTNKCVCAEPVKEGTCTICMSYKALRKAKGESDE